MNRRIYPITQHNSTVCGYPGRDFDWSKFDWVGGVKYLPAFKGLPKSVSPPPWVDDGLIEPNCQYLHVGYNFAEHGTVYRVRPNESMRAGRVYRRRLVMRQTAELIDGQWCWVLYSQ